MAPDRRGDLYEHGAKETLAEFRRRPVMVPGSLQIVAQCKPGFTFLRCQLLRLACSLKCLQPGFA
ncbi:MAG: hypothetical protein OXE86_15180, partial [Alphaproteobacteria bacterium]|nr:hypothetical protein [Alphaproteobacteria bacterium]